MRDIPYAANLKLDDKLSLAVNAHEGILGFKPEFIFSDGILREEYRKKYGDDNIYHGYVDPYDDSNLGRFRSVRIYKVSGGKKAVLHEGDRWHGNVDQWEVSGRKSKDGREIVYVTVHDLQRQYAWDREWKGDQLVLSLRCGERILRKKVLTLQERFYRFCAKGDPTQTIVEIKALGTEQQPIALVDLHFPRRTTFKALIEAELAVFSPRLRSTAIQKVASQKIRKTVRIVSPEQIRRYSALPFVGSNYGLNKKILVRR